MTQTYFKAIRVDGFDFHSQTIDYGTAAMSRTKAGKSVTHPTGSFDATSAARYFSVSTVATDCTGFRWPARLLEVEAIGDVWTPHADDMPNKRAITGARVLRELPAWHLFGREGERILAVIAARDAFTSPQRTALYAEYLKNSDEFWRVENAVVRDGRAGRAGLRAARYALRGLLDGFYDGSTTYGAALALLCRPLVGTVFTQKEYDTLSRPWRKVMGEIHPDDKPVK